MNTNTAEQTIEIESVLQELMTLREAMVCEQAIPSRRIDAVHPQFRESARNLLHYLALRRQDLRPLQLRLAALGLSSLGRAESNVLTTVDSVIDVLHRLLNRSWLPILPATERVDFDRGQRLLAEHTEKLLGPATAKRSVRIMVTMPSEAARDERLIEHLLKQGMNCMRINCAHDEPATWAKMIEHLRRAEQSLGKKCQVVMDLAGPKLRTGPLEPGPEVLKIRPNRDVFGRVINPARVWLHGDDQPAVLPNSVEAGLPVPPSWLARLSIGSRITLVDARGSKRSMSVVQVSATGCLAEVSKTAYIIPGTVLHLDSQAVSKSERDAVVKELPALENAIPLRIGDLLRVTRNQILGRPARVDGQGKVLAPASIGCSIPEVFDDAKPGEAIWFDDGKIGAIIETIDAQEVLVKITHTRENGDKLRADKGINLPESSLRLGALTEKDLDDLKFVAQHADVVELSFANCTADVELLQQHLNQLGRQPAIVLKIETRRGFANLPDMLLTAMRAPCCGVMIARGDLAVECGFERLAEVQEEILWICEAAHVPVIWATQVLESLAKDGMPSRAEITDAAMGHRAECVMLNKGPHMVRAVEVLDNILQRMQSHQTKKRSMLRELHLAHLRPS